VPTQTKIKYMPEKLLDKKIGIISGAGSLPRQLLFSLQQKEIKPYLVALNDITEAETTQMAENMQADLCWCRLGSAGRIISFFKENQVKQIVLAGGLRRPSFTSLIPDTMGLKLLNEIRKKDAIGDNILFDVIIKFLEEQGFELLGVDELATELVSNKGNMTKTNLHKRNIKDVELGKYVAQEIGNLDIGQAVIVQNGAIIGVEGIDGTDALIKRCASLQENGKGAILVKMKKPKQDRRIDLPSIGLKTIETLHENNYKGVVVEADNSLIIDKEKVIQKADELGIFIVGV
jgi:DUF1009 family protein